VSVAGKRCDIESSLRHHAAALALPIPKHCRDLAAETARPAKTQ